MSIMKKCLGMAVMSALMVSGYRMSAADAEKKDDAPKLEEQLVKDAKASIQKGVNFLTDKQGEDGAWCRHPAITALACTALLNSKSEQNPEIRKAAVEKGRKFILTFVQKDGSIWVAGQQREFPTYTTAIVLTFLAINANPEDEEIMRGARKYLLACQLDENTPGSPVKPDDPAYGGIGYAKDGKGHADLSNTQWALEALYLTEYLDKEPKAKNPEDTRKSDLAWKNAVQFMSRLQHLPESNDQVWVVKDKNDPNYGGFIYKPEDSKMDDKFKEQGLRAYGSMTYAGLKSMIYAKLKKDDPRIKAATEWAASHYTLDENPGVGPAGHYYYITTFAKAHAVLGDESVETPDKQKHLWRADVLRKLLSLQKENGEWYNDKHGRFMEAIPELVTSYSLISMESALQPYLVNP